MQKVLHHIKNYIKIFMMGNMISKNLVFSYIFLLCLNMKIIFKTVKLSNWFPYAQIKTSEFLVLYPNFLVNKLSKNALCKLLLDCTCTHDHNTDF